MAPVSGKVTYRGKPLPFGQIVMVHTAGPMQAGEIRSDGSYAIEAPVGENRVMIICQDPNIAQTPLNCRWRFETEPVWRGGWGLGCLLTGWGNSNRWLLI